MPYHSLVGIIITLLLALVGMAMALAIAERKRKQIRNELHEAWDQNNRLSHQNHVLRQMRNPPPTNKE